MHCCYRLVDSDAPLDNFLSRISGACHNLHSTDTILLLCLYTNLHLCYLSFRHSCILVYAYQSAEEDLHKEPERGGCPHLEVGHDGMLENEALLDSEFSSTSHPGCVPCVQVGFVDLGMQSGVAGDGMVVCGIVGSVVLVCSPFEGNAIDFDRSELDQASGPCPASVSGGCMAHFDTSVARAAVSASGLFGICLFV